ncbi:amidase [Rhodococcus sp. PAMC28707]|uniref:amidase n=1 Tax=unclassified Rhodococcus (in: high G+C Gram-positive bacteria) TaxID=192944 RepID=UPI00109DE4BA|nr:MULTISPECIES: amidase family protein [unclassified Rhodococcus (in: high G+C Gram-positive bacteria)]QCB49004.1 amidase [Rhodococcus sp. PAMC28705]QCB59309.1 amidase [Rhodococcus sp. PAMC28707]
MQELFDERDMTGLAKAIADKEVSVSEVVEFALARIAERNPAINALVAERSDEVRAEVAAGLPEGPLTGVPFAIKDLSTDVAGLPTTHGSRLFADAVAKTDSPIVSAYRQAGMAIVGKTNTPEWGQNASTEPALFGPTHNPHRLSHSPGGSSGGASAAVASGMLPAAHASDGGGSIRIPAAMTGLVGLKPSRGRVIGSNVLTAPLSVQHAVTRTVRDSALLLDIVSVPQRGAPVTIVQPSRPYVQEVGVNPGVLRIGTMTHLPNGTPAHADCAAAVDDVAALLASLGHQVSVGKPDFALGDNSAVIRQGTAASMAMAIDARLEHLGRGLRDDDLEAAVRVVYERTKSLGASAFPLAMERLSVVAESVGKFFADHDLLVTPTLAEPTPPLGLLDASNIESIWTYAGAYSAFASPFNITGQPAISLPLGQDSTGMPIGVQFVAAFGREDLLIRIASQIESAQPWSITPMWPPVS